MEIAFAIIAALTLVGAVAAMSLRNLVHCALCLVVAFAGLAAFYLQLGAAFVGWAQILVYVGAVAILIVFAILLTRSSENVPKLVISKSAVAGVAVALLVFGTLAWAVMSSSIARNEMPEEKAAVVENTDEKPAEAKKEWEPKVKKIGTELMTHYVLPLETMGLLLTAAAIGAVIIAMRDQKPEEGAKPGLPGKITTHH